MQRTALAIAASVAVVVLAACAGGSEDPQPTSDASASASPLPTPVTLPEVPEITDPVGVIADATFPECLTEPGETTVEGTVTNTSDAAADFLVVYSWINDGNTVLARESATVANVEPGAEADWSITVTVPEGVTNCAPLVERGEVAEG